MAGGLTVSVRQIASYPQQQVTAGLTDLVLLQTGGLGGPYASIPAATLVATALSGQSGVPSLGVGFSAPADALANIFAATVTYPLDLGPGWNTYFSSGTSRYFATGIAGRLVFDALGNFAMQISPPGQAGAPVATASTVMLLNAAGAMALPHGTLTVARDPGAAMEVATMQWVGNQTVASFNGRRGVVTLSAADIYGALGICPPDTIATMCQVDAAICAAINDALRMHPGVWSWMGRVGDVFLTVADMNFAAANNPAFMPPLTIPTPPSTATDGEVITAQWVINYLGTVTGFATEDWVNQQIAASRANSVLSFNARTGAVVLQLSDITGAGGAPLSGPNFSGVPTAPTAAAGNDSGQIATTAFVMNAISAGTAGVSSFNTRTGAVTLLLADITGAGGAPITSPSFGGVPAAPTASPGTNTTQIATTQFVEQALGAMALVSSFNGRSGAVVLTTADITGAGGAPLASPALTGNPTAPTAAPGDNDTTIATTAFVMAALGAAAPGVQSFNGRTGVVSLIGNDISAAGGALLASPAFTGTPTSTTPTAGDNSTRIATTQFVDNAIATGAVTSVNGRAGGVTIIGADITGAGGALLNSPSFTGVPTAPTAASGTTTTQIASTAFVMNAINALPAPGVTSFNTRTGAVTLQAQDLSNVGGALLASPTFTGTPSGPTASPGTNSTQLATTAFVAAAIAALPATGVTSWNTRSGAVTLQANDLSAVGGALLASPVFTGTPTTPTAAAGTSTDQIASTAFVMAAIGGAGGVLSWNGRTGAVTLSSGDLSNVGGALLAGPAFTGVPTAPTAAAGTSTTQLATTAFVAAALAANPGVTSFNTRTGAITLTAADVNAAGGPYATTAQLAGYLPLTGGQLSGPLTLTAATGANGNIGVGGNSTSASALTFGGTSPWATIQANPASGGSFLLSNISGANIANIQLQATTTTINGACNVAGGLSSASGIVQSNAANNISSAGPIWAATANFGSATFGLRAIANGPAMYWLSTYYWVLVLASGEYQYFPNAANNPVVRILLDGNMFISGNLSQGSDATTKTEITDIAEGVSLVARLQPKSYQRIQPTVTGGITLPPPRTEWGFVAQDVEPVIPNAVIQGPTQTDGSPGLFSLDYNALVATLVNAVKQLIARVQALEANANITPSAAETA